MVSWGSFASYPKSAQGRDARSPTKAGRRRRAAAPEHWPEEEESTIQAELIFAIDPGTEKCGVAALDANGDCLYRDVVPSERIGETLIAMGDRFPGVVRIVMGDGTGAGAFGERLEREGVVERFGPLEWIDEHRSSEEARRLYLRENRKGWRRWVPIGLQTPDQPIDGYVAEVLARRYLAKKHRQRTRSVETKDD